jgi:hypothetical protein
MTDRPNARKAEDAFLAAIDQALRGEPRIGRFIGQARGQMAAGEDPRSALAAAAQLLAAVSGRALKDCEQVVSLYGLAEFPTDESGTPQKVTIRTRFREVAGGPGQAIWILHDATDAAAMAEVVAPGQVWIRVDLVSSNQWPEVRALAADAAERQLGRVRPTGRRPGSKNRQRLELLKTIRERPDMTDDEIDGRGVALKVWLELLDWQDIATKKRRVAQARREASQGLGG